jgi:hypothetical protein
MKTFGFGMELLGLTLDKLLDQEERQVQQAQLLDLRVLQETQDYKERLDQLELKEMWEALDQLVPQDY